MQISHQSVATVLASLQDFLKHQREAINSDDAEACHRHLKFVEEISALVVATLENETVAAAKLVNSHSPIHRLPKEIFSEIVRQSLSSIRHSHSAFGPVHPTKAYYIQLYWYRHVATSWRDLINSTPQFWTEISTFCPPNVISTAIVHSAEAPLHIILGNQDTAARGLSFWSSAPRTADSTSTTLDTFWEYVGPHTPRWRSALFHFLPNPTLVAQRFLLNPAPLLERLQISRSQGATLESPTLATVDLLGGQAESLKELSIRSFPISWQSPLLRQVEVLSIEGRGLNIKLQQLVEILRHNFKLRDLSFDANDVEVDEGFTPDDTLALPNLERIHIPEATPVLIELVLTRLDAPRCTYISIGVTNQPFFSAEIYRRGFRAIETRLRNSLATGPISTVQLYKTRSRNLRAVWEVPGLNTPEAPKLNLRFSGWLAGSGCAWFRDLLGEVGRQVRLRVEPDSDPWSQEDLALIGTFTMVGSILLITKTSTWPFVPILFLLSRSFKTEDGITLRQNFPQLHEIVVRYSEGIDMRLREAIQERYDPERLSGVEGAPSLTLDLRPSHALTEADWNVGRLFVGLRGVEAVTMRGVAVKSV